MFNVRLAGDHPFGKWVFICLSLVMSLMVSVLCRPFSHEMSCMRPGTELSQSLRIFLPTLSGTDRSRTKSLSKTLKGKIDNYILTHNKITDDKKPSQQRFPNRTQLSYLN